MNSPPEKTEKNAIKGENTDGVSKEEKIREKNKVRDVIVEFSGQFQDTNRL